MAKIALARGSNAGVIYSIETWNDTTKLDEANAWTRLRNTGSTLSYSVDTSVSTELTGKRGITALNRGNKQTTGNFNYELSYGNFDDFLLAGLESEKLTFKDGATYPMRTDGTTIRTFAFEKGIPDANHYEVFTGLAVNKISLDVKTGGPVTGSVDMIGAGFSINSVSQDATPTEPTDSTPITAYKGECTLKLGGAAATDIAYVTGISFSIDNGLTPAFVLYQDTAANVLDGKCTVEGSIDLFFKNGDMVKAYRDALDVGLSFTMTQDTNAVTPVADGVDGYKVDIPKLQLKSADINIGDAGPMHISVPFQALEGADGYTIGITKIANTAQ